jgi:polar amino acid transport system permease protein
MALQAKSVTSRITTILSLVIGLLIIGTAFGVEMIVNPPETPPFDLLPTLLRGLAITIQLTIAGGALAFIVAIIAGAARASRHTLIRWITGFYVEVFRGTSILVQMFWIFFVLPLKPFNVELSAFQAGVVALGLNVGAYGAEVVRGALLATPKGQVEAAIALNMPPFLRLRRVILPQAMVRILPPFGNLLIELLKATALVSLITLGDVTLQALTLRQTVGRTPEIFGLLIVIYFLIAYPLTIGVRWLESRRQWA